MSQVVQGATGSPFDNGHTDPWTKTFVDLPELNARATQAIAAAIRDVSAAARRGKNELRAKSILVLGPAGAGKTHLFARLRRTFGPRAVFVHLRPLVGTEMTPRYVLGQIVQQLTYEVPEGLKQLDVLVGSSLAHLDGSPPEYPRSFLDEVAALDDVERRKRLDVALESLLERHPEADETYLQRLLDAPFMKPTLQRAARAWLEGRELEDAQMSRLGVRSSIPDERILAALQTLGVFAAPGAPIVLVFDQLENLVDAEAAGPRIRAYGNLVSELFDTLRGYVLVQMALDSEWQRGIQPLLSEAQRTRLAGHVEVMSLPTPDERRELMKRWVEQLSVRDAPFPWPFGERRVSAWCRAPGMTPRMLLLSCKQALALGADADEEDDPPTTERTAEEATDAASDDDALDVLWEEHLVSARAALDEAAADRRAADPARIIGGMACALRFVDATKTSRVDARQPLQILARIGPFVHAVALLHQTHWKAVLSALERVAESTATGAVLVARERALEFPPTWKKVIAAKAALEKKGARWLTLQHDDAASLLALESFLAAATSRDLENGSGRAFAESEAVDWLRRERRVAEWPFVAALVGAPEDAEAPPPDAAPKVAGHAPTTAAPGSAAASAAEGESAPDAAEERAGARVDATATTVRVCLQQLGVASLDRLVREVARLGPAVTRAEVEGVLVTMRDRVRWFGRSIVADGGEP